MHLSKLTLLILLLTSIINYSQSGQIALTTRASNTANIISTEKLEVVSTFSTGNGPHELCCSPDGKYIYTANYAMIQFKEGQQRPTVSPDSSITVFDIEQNKVVKTIKLGKHIMTHAIIASNDGKKLWLSSERNNAVIEVDIESGKITNQWQAGRGCHMLVASPDNKFLYATNVGSGSITIINLETNEVKEVKTGPFSEGVAISPNGLEIWTGNRGDHSISVYSTLSDSVTNKFESKGMTPFRLYFTPNGKECWVITAESNDINIFDANTKEWIKKMDFEEMPFALVFNPDGTKAYVTHTDTDGLSEIDVNSLTVINRVSISKEPDGIIWVK